MPRLFGPLMVLLHSLSGEQSGVFIADSTKLGVCQNRRINRHKVFDGLAARGKTSTGWFFGLKLHFVINHKGQVMALRITPGNIADSTVLDEITQHLTGKLYADKGYISREMFRRLWQRGLHLITGIRRNMRNHLMPLADKLMLRKRFVIETVLAILKCEMGLEHSRHRSPVNAMVHVLSCLRRLCLQTQQTFHCASKPTARDLSVVRIHEAKPIPSDDEAHCRGPCPNAATVRRMRESAQSRHASAPSTRTGRRSGG